MELARRAGVSPSYVSLIEHGEKIPSEDVAVRLAQALEEREDLYRVWAVTARMDERTREAVLRAGRSGELGSELPNDAALTPSGLSSMPPGQPALGEGTLRGLHEERAAHAVALPLLVPRAAPKAGSLAPEEVESLVTIDRRLLGEPAVEQLVVLRTDAINVRRVRAWLREGDLAVIRREPRPRSEGGIVALRLGDDGLVFARVTLSDGHVLLLADPTDDAAPQALPLGDGENGEASIFGSLVATFRRWPAG